MKISSTLDALLDLKRIEEMELFIKDVNFERQDLFPDRRPRKVPPHFRFTQNGLYHQEKLFGRIDHFVRSREIDNSQLRFGSNKEPILGNHLPPGLRTLNTYQDYKLKQFSAFS